MAATPEVLFELDDSDATIGILIGQGNKGTSFTSFDRHFRHDRNAGTSGNHCQDGCELAALKHDVGLQLGAAAHPQLDSQPQVCSQLLHELQPPQ